MSSIPHVTSTAAAHPDSGVNLHFFAYVVLTIFVSAWCTIYRHCNSEDREFCISTFLCRRQGESLQDAQTRQSLSDREVAVPIKFDSQERKAFVLRNLVERKVTFAHLPDNQSSTNHSSDQKQEIEKLKCMVSNRFNDLEAPTIDSDVANEGAHFQEIIMEQGAKADISTIDASQIHIPSESLADVLELTKMQAVNSFSNERFSTAEVSAPDNIGDFTFLASAECSICMEGYKECDMVCWSRNLSCSHAFHTECLLPWLMHHNICPNCRSIYIPAEQVVRMTPSPSPV